MDYVLLVITVLAFQTTLSTAIRRGADSPNWELRWSALPPADRARITTAARLACEIADPEDAELAAGFNRRRERRLAYVEASVFFLLALFTALSLLGVAAGLAGSGLAAVGFASGLWHFLGRKRLTGTPRRAARPSADT